MAEQEKLMSVGSPTTFLIGAKLREAREEQKITLTEMAKRLGYTKSYLSGVENGKERATEALIRHYEKELELQPGELSEAIYALRTDTPFSLTSAITSLIKSAPRWLDILQITLFDEEKNKDIEKDIFDRSKFARPNEQELSRHLALALRNAAERGLAAFHSPEERDQYREILTILTEQNPQNDAFIQQILRALMLTDKPNLAELNKLFNQSLLMRSVSRSNLSKALDAAPYLNSFFEALIAELYIDPLFHDRIGDVLQERAARSMQRSLPEVVATLRQIGDTLAYNYTPEQFEKDVRAYTEHIERTLRYLKLVGVAPKERTRENRDPELNGIFVSLSISMQDPIITDGWASGSITERLESFPCLVLLGDPGSGKSTITRYLAWSHAAANLSESDSLTISPLLSGEPLPLRIELRHLNEVRKQRPDFNFLTYTSEVLLGRAGLDITPQMFEVLLERRTMLVLFDGLDEVATLDDRRLLVEEIESFTQLYPGNHFLVTSRFVGYELAPLNAQTFSHARIEPFNNQQIQQFLEHWYMHVLRLWPLSPDDQEELEELYSALKDNLRLYSLAENPLLLTVITALHRYERLPDRRILIYDRCADLLLETWSRLKGTNLRWQYLKLSKEDQYACLAHLGFVLHEREQEKQENDIDLEDATSTSDFVNDVSSRFLLREIESFLQGQNLFPSKAEQNTQAKCFLNQIQEEAGLIVERGMDESGEVLYGFVHRVFQEYFAAADVYERFQQEADLIIISDFLREHLFDPHWREVILLLLGKLKRRTATVLLKEILEGKIKGRHYQGTYGEQQNLLFVCDCLIEEIAVENDLVEAVLSQLGDVIKSSSISSQREEALAYLNKLIQTRQYGNLEQSKLIEILAKENISDIDIQK